MNLVTHRGQPYEYEETESGLKLFSVTQIRQVAHDSYAGIPEDKLEAARDRGTRLHRRFWRVLAAQEGLCTVPLPIPGLEGYCQAQDHWVAKNKVRPRLLEQKSLNKKLGYAGTTDAQVLYGNRDWITLTDLKSGEPTLTDAMQLLAYNEMENLKSHKLLDLYIRADGTYREVWVTVAQKAREWPAFLNALSLLRWRTTHGIR